MRQKWLSATLVLLAACGFAAAPAAAAERIAAIVNKTPILESEVEEALKQAMAQYRVDPADSATVGQLRKEVVRQLIDEQVILAEAARQGITVPRTEVDQEVERQVSEVKRRFPTTQDYEKALAQENLTEASLRAKYQGELQRQLLVRKMVGREVQSKTNVTDPEVRAYFESRRDSLPRNPERLRLAAIVVEAQPDSPLVKRGRARADSLRNAIVKGKPFAEVAAAASDDPSGVRGGDLGTFARGMMVPEFEEIAFGLAPNEVSKPFRSRFGWHVLEVMEHAAATDSLPERVHARHILVAVRPSTADEERARKRALGLRDSLRAGADFAALAKRHSADSATRDSGGVLGEIPLPELPATFQEPLAGLGVGEVSVPLKGEAGLYIFKVLGRVPESEFKFEEIKDRLRDMLLDRKLRDGYQRWLDRIRKNVNVELKS